MRLNIFWCFSIYQKNYITMFRKSLIHTGNESVPYWCFCKSQSTDISYYYYIRYMYNLFTHTYIHVSIYNIICLTIDVIFLSSFFLLWDLLRGVKYNYLIFLTVIDVIFFFFCKSQSTDTSYYYSIRYMYNLFIYIIYVKCNVSYYY